MNRDLLEQRLAALQAEYQAGDRMLAEIDEKRENLETTMLRIEGAMQVLCELLQQHGYGRSTQSND